MEWDHTTKNIIVDKRIKEMTLVSLALYLHSTRLGAGYAITILRPFLFKADCQRYNRFDMD